MVLYCIIKGLDDGRYRVPLDIINIPSLLIVIVVPISPWEKPGYNSLTLEGRDHHHYQEYGHKTFFDNSWHLCRLINMDCLTLEVCRFWVICFHCIWSSTPHLLVFFITSFTIFSGLLLFGHQIYVPIFPCVFVFYNTYG